MSLIRILLGNLILLYAASIIGCSAGKVKESVEHDVEQRVKGPETKPHKNITNFSESLRCMDNLLIDYGVRDISMIVEDLNDKTQRIQAGTKDMLITAFSKMNQRSRAIKVIPYGEGSGNLIQFLHNSGSMHIYNRMPQYDIRGSISQLDHDFSSAQSGPGLSLEKLGLGLGNMSIGSSTSSQASILAVDLSILSTADLSIIPGLTSNNAVALFKTDRGGESSASGAQVVQDSPNIASIVSSAIQFNFKVSKRDAVIQALRNLIELASIELVGRLTKIPYWECLDVPSSTADVQLEIQDWFYAMQAHGELIPYVRNQLIHRGFYPLGESNTHQAMLHALNNFQNEVGLGVSENIDFYLFKELLSRPPSNKQRESNSASYKSKRLQSSININEANLTIKTQGSKRKFSHGDKISLLATSKVSAYLFCYIDDGEGNVQRFFPNRFHPDNFIPARTSISFPGNMPVDLLATDHGEPEKIACFATRKNILSNFPRELHKSDFENLGIKDFTPLSQAFMQATSGDYAASYITIEIE